MNKKKLIIVLAVAILVFLTGIATALLTTKDSLVNNFTVGENKCEIIETFGNYNDFTGGCTYEKNVTVKNTGTVDCYVRVFAEIEDPNISKAINIDFNTSEWTTKQADGYYYYKKVLKPTETTVPIFTKLLVSQTLFDFKMIVYAETVQADGSSDPVKAFKL